MALLRVRCDACEGAIAEADDTVTVGGRLFHAGCVEAAHIEGDGDQERRGRIARWFGWMGWGHAAG